MGTKDLGAGLMDGLGEKVRPRVEAAEEVSAEGPAGATSADWNDVAAAP
jgi:hypothetical protein